MAQPDTGALANKHAADMRAKVLASTIQELRAAGFVSRRAIARELSRRQVPTARGGKKWYFTSVTRLLARLGDLQDND